MIYFKAVFLGISMFLLAALATGNVCAQDGSRRHAPGRVTRKLEILEKPPAAYPKIEGTVHIQGAVTLRVTFGADGLIKNVAVVSRLPYGLTESAVDAARKIKFRPQKVDGRPVTVTKIIQYSFHPF